MTTSYAPIRIILADDHEIFREGFKVLMKKQGEIELIDEASDGRELIRLVKDRHPDVVITDIKMPLMDGIEVTKVLQQEVPYIGIIALSMFDEDNLIVEMLEAGAKGYLLKNAHKTEIVAAVKAVYHQQTYYCNHTTMKLVQMIAKSSFNPYRKFHKPEFSEREMDIIRLICREFSNKKIADQFHLSVRTVESHREKIMEKMGVKNTAGIVVYAIKNKLYTL